MEEEASTASKEGEEVDRWQEEEFDRKQWQPVDQWQWQPGSVVAGEAPDLLLLSEKDLQPGRVEFVLMEAARDAIKTFLLE